MRTYVKTLLVLIAVILYSPVVNAQSGESYGWEQAPRYRGFISEGYVFGTGDVKENRSFLSLPMEYRSPQNYLSVVV